MNTSPLNYLITIALGAVLWVITAILFGGSFSDSLLLAISTPEEFSANLRIFLGIAAGVGILNSLYWYYYGNQDSTAGELDKAKRIWWTSFISQVTASAGLLGGLIYVNLTEGLISTEWLIIYGLMALHTWFFFWLSTFLMSPRTVKYIPLFK